MRYIADLHVHSYYSRATSRALDLDSLYHWAQIKGIDVVGTGDFTHPAWREEIREKLVCMGNGFFKLKERASSAFLPEGMHPEDRAIYFCLSTEVNCIYRYEGRVYKSHHLIYVPDFSTAEKLSRRLSAFGDLAADGRPTLTMSAHQLLEIVLSISPRAHLIPAHIWTPWFAILGSRSGYDSVAACFRDLTPHIFALETGLSSDPAMNWRWSVLDRYAMVSNSDAHSPSKLGREATLFHTDMCYDALFQALKTKKGFSGTLEFFPEEGKYHLDGHRNCKVSFRPDETRERGGICPICKRALTIGVLHRVDRLSDRARAHQPADAPSFRYIVPLPEIIAEITGRGVKTKCVEGIFMKIIHLFGNEFFFLLEAPIADIASKMGDHYALAISNLREGKVVRDAGYDGLYGRIHLYQQTLQRKLELL